MPRSIGEAIQAAARQLAAADPPRLEAEVLLGHVLHCPRSHVIAHPERRLTAAQHERYVALISRRAAGEPVAHLTGEREFWSLSLTLSRDVLIPRPETEHLVAAALDVLPAGKATRMIDAGTGSGAIALAVAGERPLVHVIASERWHAALSVARTNGKRLRRANVAFVRADWLAPFAPNSVDLIVSNPPYLSADDPHLSRGDLRYEPRAALVAAERGLADLYRLADSAFAVLRPGGWLWLEHGAGQAEAVRSRLCRRGYRRVATHNDWAGHPRVSGGHRPVA